MIEAKRKYIKKPKLIKMFRDSSYPKPHTADIHPDMINEAKSAGWRIVQEIE